MDLARTGATAQQPLSPLIKWVLPGSVVALTVALIRGYEFHWTSTGVIRAINSGIGCACCSSPSCSRQRWPGSPHALSRNGNPGVGLGSDRRTA